MNWIMNRKRIKILTCFLSFVVIASFLSLRSQSKELSCQYPTMQVANYLDGEWGTYNILTDGRSDFRYRLNFSFPQHELAGNYLRNFRVIVMIPPGFAVQQPVDRIRVHTVRNEVDVTEYFEIISVWMDYSIQELEIVARDIALTNPRFYRNWAHLYVELQVGNMFKILPTNWHWIFGWIYYLNLNFESQIIDLNIPCSFRVVGEFYNGEVFDKTSNMVHTYYYLTFLLCGCYLDCICDYRNALPPWNEDPVND